jgi:hypothetical protein
MDIELPLNMDMEREVDINTEKDMIMDTDTGKHADMEVYEIKIVDIGYLTLDCLAMGLVRYRIRLRTMSNSFWSDIGVSCM